MTLCAIELCVGKTHSVSGKFYIFCHPRNYDRASQNWLGICWPINVWSVTEAFCTHWALWDHVAPESLWIYYQQFLKAASLLGANFGTDSSLYRPVIMLGRRSPPDSACLWKDLSQILNRWNYGLCKHGDMASSPPSRQQYESDTGNHHNLW